jgi:hypothetical protein
MRQEQRQTEAGTWTMEQRRDMGQAHRQQAVPVTETTSP